MKVLFLDQSGKPGGAELCLIDIAKPYRDHCLLPSRQKNPEEYVFTQEGQGSQREIHSLRVGME
jgi:hypothetical protein